MSTCWTVSHCVDSNHFCYNGDNTRRPDPFTTLGGVCHPPIFPFFIFCMLSIVWYQIVTLLQSGHLYTKTMSILERPLTPVSEKKYIERFYLLPGVFNTFMLHYIRDDIIWDGVDGCLVWFLNVLNLASRKSQTDIPGLFIKLLQSLRRTCIYFNANRVFLDQSCLHAFKTKSHTFTAGLKNITQWKNDVWMSPNAPLCLLFRRSNAREWCFHERVCFR